MGTNKFEPINHTNARGKKGNTAAYITSALFGSAAIFFLGFCIYTLLHGVWAGLLLLLCAIVLGFFAVIFFPTERRVIYSFELNETGIVQRWDNRSTGKQEENRIPFEEMDQVLIGMFANRIVMPRARDFYRFEALLIIMYQGKYFFQRFLSAEDLHEWVIRLEDRVPIRYTDMDLCEALIAHANVKVDFSQIEGTAADLVSEHIGKESYRNPFSVWMPEKVQEEVKANKEAVVKPKTRKAEKLLLAILFGYTLCYALLFFPGMPLDEDGYIEVTDGLLLGYHGVLLLLPVFLVFWRSYTKWYNPILYTFVSMIGSTVGVFLASLVKDFSPLYESIIVLNIVNLIFWLGALIVIKIFKVVANFTYKHNINI